MPSNAMRGNVKARPTVRMRGIPLSEKYRGMKSDSIIIRRLVK